MIDKSNISIKLSVLGYAIFGTGMTLANKECMKKYPYPEALLVFQSCATVLFVTLYGRRGILFKITIIFEWIPITILFALILLSSLYALKYVSVPSLVVVRSCSSLSTAFADFYYRGIHFSRVGVGYLLAILFCSLLYALEDIHFHPVGYSWLFLNLISTTFYQVLIKEVIEKYDLTTKSIAFYNNTLLFIIMSSHQIYSKQNSVRILMLDRKVYVTVFVSIIWGICLSLSSSHVNRILTPTSVMVANNVNKFALILISELFVEISQSLHSIIICIFVLVFGALYSRHQVFSKRQRASVKLRRNAKKDLFRAIVILIFMKIIWSLWNKETPHFRPRRLFHETEIQKEKTNHNKFEHFGIMLVKDEGAMLEAWIDVHLKDFDYIFMIDGSQSNNMNNTKRLIKKHKNIFYIHEQDLELKVHTDSELRRAGYMKLSDDFGYGKWITFAYCDEFYLHDPRKIIQLADTNGVDGIEWYALHILPHPTEYELFSKNRASSAVKLFRHYHHYTHGAWKEFRTFKSDKKLEFETKWSSTHPRGLKKLWDRHPAYLHFKVKEIDPSNYDSHGHHRHTFENARLHSKIGSISDSKKDRSEKKLPHTGLSWPIRSERDFFVRSYIGKPKYTRCTRYNGTLLPELDEFEASCRHDNPLPL